MAPDWRNSVEYRWIKSGHIPSDALEPFLGSGVPQHCRWGAPIGSQKGPKKGPKRPKTAFSGHKRIWWSPKGTPDPSNSSIESPWMCPDLFHLYSTLFRQSGATTPPYGTKIEVGEKVIPDVLNKHIVIKGGLCFKYYLHI